MEYIAPGDSMLDVVLVPIHYMAMIRGECLEAIVDLDNKVVHHDLMVGNLPSLLLASSDGFPIASSS